MPGPLQKYRWPIIPKVFLTTDALSAEDLWRDYFERLTEKQASCCLWRQIDETWKVQSALARRSRVDELHVTNQGRDRMHVEKCNYQLVKGRDRHFEIMHTLLVINECFMRAFLTDTHEWESDDYCWYQCKAVGAFEIRLPLVGPVADVKAGKVIESITLTLATSNRVPDPKRDHLNVNFITFKMVSPFFTELYEDGVSFIRKTFGSNPKDWPSIWNYARVVRNAAAHNGVLAIDSPSSPTATWKNLSYGHAQNGQAIFGTDLSIGDMLMLMFELVADLDSRNAPIVLPAD